MLTKEMLGNTAFFSSGGPEIEMGLSAEKYLVSKLLLKASAWVSDNDISQRCCS